MVENVTRWADLVGVYRQNTEQGLEPTGRKMRARQMPSGWVMDLIEMGVL
jgi:hypothetical protein